ncbi:MAG: septum formation initiator family protein [Frankia sp.]|nr:septum formation initiator family protein [Frankia sp.]
MPRLPRRTTLTTRATLLAVVICVLVLTLAYPLRLYLQQQAEITDLTQENAARQQRVDALRSEVARYDDQEWVEDEARRRLHYVRPGDQLYLMPASPTPTPDPSARRGGASSDDAWYSQLWTQAGAQPQPSPGAGAGR